MRILVTFFVTATVALSTAWAAAAQPQKSAAHLSAVPPAASGQAPQATLPRTARIYGGTPIDVLNYHYDNNRTGWNQAETDLTPAAIASSSFGLLKTLQVDGNVFAQPLLAAGYTMPDGTIHDVLIIATGHDTVWAFDAQSFAVLWSVSLGTPQSTMDVGCPDVKPEYGIASTPVILRNNGSAVIYVVAATEPSPMQFQTSLHALDLGTGADVLTPSVISPSATLSNASTLNFDPKDQYNRASLASANGAIYVGIGSHCDRNKGLTSGWLLRYDAATLSLASQFHTIETRSVGLELASIWMSGFAPAIDPSGNVFVATGNGAFKTEDWGQSVLNLAPDLTRVTDSFTPGNYKQLNAINSDLGSGGVMLLPPVSGQTAPPMAVLIGKDAVLYLLNQTNLGGVTPMDTGALQTQRLAPSRAGTYGGPAFYDSPVAGPLVYLQTDHANLRAFSLAAGATPSLTPVAQGSTAAGMGGSLPIVTSNGAVPGTGVVWLVRRSTPPAVEAYSADGLGAPIFSANISKWSNTSGNAFLTPMVANGRVYVPGYKSVSVFGLAGPQAKSQR